MSTNSPALIPALIKEARYPIRCDALLGEWLQDGRISVAALLAGNMFVDRRNGGQTSVRRLECEMA